MLILPVVDLMGGQVVRGIAGRRAEYRPVAGVLAADARPATVARAFVEQLGLRAAYVADLDSSGGEPDWNAYEAIAGCGLDLWVDAGVSDVSRAGRLAEFAAAGRPLARIIVGLESLPHFDSLRDLVGAIGADRAVFSLDLNAGEPLLSEQCRQASGGRQAPGAIESTAIANRWANAPRSPVDIAAFAVSCGVRSTIVLDLARVGVGQGISTNDLCRRIHSRFPDLDLISGGGVRDRADLRALADCGCRAALVASALHDGKLSASDLAHAAAW
jgi:phosphoribosylformimino-5-aminoimidazole carboxamide ribotide isomerase